jgi:plastocyanin
MKQLAEDHSLNKQQKFEPCISKLVKGLERYKSIHKELVLMAKVSTVFNLGQLMLSVMMLAVLLLPGCTAQMGTGGTPQITITAPKEGDSLPAGNVTVMANVMNFNLVNKLGQANVPGEGHLHYYFDVPVPRTPGKPAVTAVGTFAPTPNTTFTWTNVKPGKHNFSAQLANNDHTPLIPLVYSTVNVTVAAPTMKTMSLQNVTINLVAKNLAFNTSKITVPAGVNVTVNFDNQDQYIPHNFAVYTDASAKTVLYQGKTITGPAKATYTFTAPTKAGTYYFRCDTHPQQMNGQFMVQ